MHELEVSSCPGRDICSITELNYYTISTLYVRSYTTACGICTSIYYCKVSYFLYAYLMYTTMPSNAEIFKLSTTTCAVIEPPCSCYNQCDSLQVELWAYICVPSTELAYCGVFLQSQQPPTKLIAIYQLELYPELM